MTTDQPLEIELKLTLPAQQVEAFRRRMARRRNAPTQQELVTRYFDTPDFDLSAAGVALRVRRVGGRWLQTLKTEGERQGGLSRRVEFEMPVNRGTPDWSRFPPEAQGYVPEALRGKLLPVFETRFERTAWQIAGARAACIEVALDRGELLALAGARRQPICEIELELKAGDVDALFALALQWAAAFDCLPFDVSKAERGARLARGVVDAPVKSVAFALGRDMSVEEGFAAICRACLAQFQANLPGVLGRLADVSSQAGERAEAREGATVGPQSINDDIEYVHQARVALRRLRAALRLFRKACALPEELLGPLRVLVDALGPARDWDVLCTETLPAIAPHHDDAAAWQRGMQALQARREAVRAAMRDAVQQARPGVWLLAFERWLQQRGWRRAADGAQVGEAQRFVQLAPLGEWASRALRRQQRPIVRGARRFAELEAPARHALRIAIKRQRYAGEFFQALYPARRQAAYLATLRAAQDSLGRGNDAHVAFGLLSGAGVDAGPMGEFARGWLAAQQAGAGDGDSAAHLRVFLGLKPYW
jgi:inorganic triphosphatase YgiF